MLTLMKIWHHTQLRRRPKIKKSIFNLQTLPTFEKHSCSGASLHLIVSVHFFQVTSPLMFLPECRGTISRPRSNACSCARSGSLQRRDACSLASSPLPTAASNIFGQNEEHERARSMWHGIKRIAHSCKQSCGKDRILVSTSSDMALNPLPTTASSVWNNSSQHDACKLA